MENRLCLFGDVEGWMRLNACGRIVLGRWRALPRHFSRVRLDAFVVMPNHIHGIVVIKSHSPDPATSAGESSPDDGGESTPTRGEASAGTPPPERDEPTPVNKTGLPGDSMLRPHRFLNVVIRRGRRRDVGCHHPEFQIDRFRGAPGTPVWQRGYWDHILRDERAVRRYIEQNPARWTEGCK